MVTGNEVISAANLKAVVNAINGADGEVPSVADHIWPIGSIYLSVNSTNPGTLFGGTWQRIQDVFLLAAGSTYSAGSTGGEATHTLTVDEMPSHNHTASIPYNKSAAPAQSGPNAWRDGDGYKLSATTNSVGGGAAHNNMPPYLAVYAWKRTA